MAGLVGGAAAAFVLWGSWFLPVLGLLLTRADLINGFAVMLGFGAIGGVLYAVALRRRDLTASTSLLAGVVLGLVLWVAGPLLLVPVALGFPVQLGSPLNHLTPLIAFLLYGIITGLLYGRMTLRHGPAVVYSSIALLLLAVISAPVMLRMAASTDPEALELPDGYEAEVVAKGFTYPTSMSITDDGTVYIGESGFVYGPKTTEARIMSVSPTGEVAEIASGFNGPLNGLDVVDDDTLLVSHRGKISQLCLDTGETEDLIADLPAKGDHHNNEVVAGPDGEIYFGVGTATNAGVVGSDSFVYAWADRHPDFHDQPSRSFELTGENYPHMNLGTPNPLGYTFTGAFAPFGETRSEGEVVEETVPASGAIHRIDADGSVSVYADGLRNPYGLVMDDDSTLYATNLGYDDRGVRAVSGSPDWVVEVHEGAWYGWPDFAGGNPLTEEQFASERGVNLNPLISDPPEVEAPLLTLPSHYSPMKLTTTPQDFNHEGLLVAIFGDATPLTGEVEEDVPTGVIHVDVLTGDYDWFVSNQDQARFGRTGRGFKRIIAVEVDHEDAGLYVLDFGVVEFTDMSPNAIPETGVLWRITRNSQE